MSKSIIQPKARLLMGPGPSNVSQTILSAMAQPTIGHLDPTFSDIMEEVKRMLRDLFQTENKLTIPLSGPGSVAMETCFVNLVEPGDNVIVCINGVFGERMADIIQRCGANATKLEFVWGEDIKLDTVERAIIHNPQAKLLAFVHAETSTGVRSNALGLCKLAKQHGLLSIVDTVTSLGGISVNVDQWKADAVYSGTQKCLSCPPGLSMITLSDTARKRIEKRKTKIQSWFMDLSLIESYWQPEGGRTYHHTAPVNNIYALYQALLDLYEEGLDNRINRHKNVHEKLVYGLEGLGLSMAVDRNIRLPQLNSVSIPDGINESLIRNALLEHYNIEIGAGLGMLKGKVWR
ncbi:MAG: alanine--glyoxylate aminotransferase, partial [Rhodospirillaceae bacterium]|nr:alanine--glyoxylate aminotransferase [Rhodospirillaceae bacterium]